MSLYRTVYTDLPCLKCGESRRTAVQFRTGNDNLEEYEQGQGTTTAEGLRAGDEYTGTADSFCKACVGLRKQEESQAFYQALAELIESGRLQLLKGMLIKKRVKPEELSHWAEMAQMMFEDGEKKIPSPFATLAEYELIWDDKPAKQGTPPYSILLEHLNERMATKMRFSGWATLNLLRDDLTVRIDENHHIQAERSHAHHSL